MGKERKGGERVELFAQNLGELLKDSKKHLQRMAEELGCQNC